MAGLEGRRGRVRGHGKKREQVGRRAEGALIAWPAGPHLGMSQQWEQSTAPTTVPQPQLWGGDAAVQQEQWEQGRWHPAHLWKESQ